MNEILCYEEELRKKAIRNCFSDWSPEKIESFQRHCEENAKKKEELMRDIIADEPDSPYEKVMYYLELLRQCAVNLTRDKFQYAEYLFSVFFDIAKEEPMQTYIYGIKGNDDSAWTDYYIDHNPTISYEELMKIFIKAIEELQQMPDGDVFRHKLNSFFWHVLEVYRYLFLLD